MANIKIAQLTNQIDIADTDLIIIESATSTNKMSVGNFRKLIEPNWKLIASSAVSIGGTETLTVTEKIKEVMVVGAVYNSVVFTKAVQSLDPNNSIVKKIQDGNNTQKFIVAVQIIGDSSIYVAPLATSDQGVSAVFYR